MNIYMSGAHGTGKTTTAKIITEKTGMTVLPSASRNSPYEQGTYDHQDYVMDQVWKRCLRHDNTIHERTPFDVYAYTNAMHVEALVEKHRMKIDAFARSIKQRGESLFYFPITFELHLDEFRPDEMMQLTVDSIMRHHIERTEIPCIFIPDGTPEERANFILEESSYAKL